MLGIVRRVNAAENFAVMASRAIDDSPCAHEHNHLPSSIDNRTGAGWPPVRSWLELLCAVASHPDAGDETGWSVNIDVLTVARWSFAIRRFKVSSVLILHFFVPPLAQL